MLDPKSEFMNPDGSMKLASKVLAPGETFNFIVLNNFDNEFSPNFTVDINQMK